MRYTLLELTQLILSSMDSDEVNSITDTVESVQVTTILKNVFYDMATELDLPEHETLFELTASGDNTKPAIMTIPTDVTKLTSIKYDNAATADTYVDWKDVTFITHREMILQLLRHYRGHHTTGLQDRLHRRCLPGVHHNRHLRTRPRPYPVCLLHTEGEDSCTL
jgi:hypothetical protein